MATRMQYNEMQQATGVSFELQENETWSKTYQMHFLDKQEQLRVPTYA